MARLLTLILFLISGSAAGWFCVDFLPDEVINQIFLDEGILKPVVKELDIRFLLAGIGALFGLLLGFIFQQLRKQLFGKTRSMPTDLLFSRAIGLILGLLVANLILAPILLLPLPKEIVLVKTLVAILSNIFFGVLGYNLAEVHGRTLLRLFNPNSTEALLIAEGILTPASAKVIDTSIIIDGRINGMLRSGLLEGQIIIAQSVLEELQKLADSSNNEKRAKGRRGLKLLNKLREDFGRKLIINNTRYDVEGTDEQLLKLTEDTGGTLITIDYNLSQVAQLKELNVLNLSELVIALRADIHPGEKLSLKIVREGKEEKQGIGYLDDGTMVVIEGGKDSIGERLDVLVTGELQTPTGRMIFGKPAKGQPPHKSNKTKAL